MRNPHLPSEVAALIDQKFPRVITLADDGCLIIAATADLVLWVRDNKILQTWRRYG